MIARTRGARPAAAGMAAPPATQPKAADPGRASAHVVTLDPGFYAFRMEHETGWERAGLGFAVPVVQVAAPPDQAGTIEVTDAVGAPGAWLGGPRRVLFVKTPAGGTALVTAYLARDPDAAPLRLAVFRLSESERSIAAAEDTGQPLIVLNLSGIDEGGWPRPVTLSIVAHIRGRGDVRFVETPWAGRLGTGQWIEAFALSPRPSHIAASLEYKGLMAGGGETDWLPCGTACGTHGQGTPLLGFAIRQKPGPNEMRYDCEYSGYFGSGATGGPSRNGAPCRSLAENDPLEGMQVTINRRPARMPTPRA